ncbi:hypothetical protein H6P81_019507 [Aristolochia fimbriata]|uniref:O-fucosyltransferase family protein n=1 Tax=Aristolochia fimbriata TaxID=158543 RepID=A0AAV7DRZ8_ARIFI|nr:hypothetical protein H6P81_019507 [Aristolochia fimbriata]
MKVKKGISPTVLSSISVKRVPISFHSNFNKHSSSTAASPKLLISPRRAGYVLFLLAVSVSLSIFRLNFPPSSPCSDNYPRPRSLNFMSPDWSSTTTTVGGSYSSEYFWKQPDGFGFRPCLNFSKEYREAATNAMFRTRKRYLLVVASGGLNQQKNQIVDAVVMARIMEAVLVLPVLQVNKVWGDESEFSDIFDERIFKETLREEVRVVSSLPASHLRRRPAAPPPLPMNMDEEWVRVNLMERLNKDGILILRGFDSRLSKDLHPDLQKLRCKVAFHALKFRPWIEGVGEKLAKRMGKGGPYMALHLRLEKDVWVRTGCLPGLGDEADRTIERERKAHPELLTSRSNMTPHDRYIAGLCPLNAFEISRLLKGLGASKRTRIYWAGGDPFGGNTALKPLVSSFPYMYNKWNLTRAGELDQFKHKPSILAAIDYIVCLKSHVFMANHGGNMARSLQGHRAYNGHQKYIMPNKRELVKLFVNKSLSEGEMEKEIKMIHANSLGSPLLRTDKRQRDVIAFPVPECMCSTKRNS